jgi:hypothetical protein
MERGLIPNTTSRIQIFWSEILSSASAKFGISSVSAIILVFRQFLQLFWYFVFPSAFAIW